MHSHGDKERGVDFERSCPAVFILLVFPFYLCCGISGWILCWAGLSSVAYILSVSPVRWVKGLDVKSKKEWKSCQVCNYSASDGACKNNLPHLKMEVDEASMLALTKLFLKSIVSEFISTKPPHIFVLALAQTVNCSYAPVSYTHLTLPTSLRV